MSILLNNTTQLIMTDIRNINIKRESSILVLHDIYEAFLTGKYFR